MLVQLTRVEGSRHGKLLASQMMDVTIRVKAIRPYAVQCLVSQLSCGTAVALARFSGNSQNILGPKSYFKGTRFTTVYKQFDFWHF